MFKLPIRKTEGRKRGRKKYKEETERDWAALHFKADHHHVLLLLLILDIHQ